ncbi:hypothetical protein [Massilia sp. 9096]|uniref:hypothetical protein n=1 Tax=Massilia sp. 9096 TaxID=1500894 RepID=UPI000AEE1D87|nr:hypothetical protein [Massilia sp. 9096]
MPTTLFQPRAQALNACAGVFTILLMVAAPARAADASTPSTMSVDASAMVVTGSLLSVAAAGSAVVASVEVVGDGIDLVLDAAGQASVATVKLSAGAARGISLAAGTTLQVAALSTGTALVASGRVIAFIPNAAGKALLHHARVD